MLCNLKIHRPDKLLQKRLITLAYSLVALTITLIGFLHLSGICPIFHNDYGRFNSFLFDYDH